MEQNYNGKYVVEVKDNQIVSQPKPYNEIGDSSFPIIPTIK